MGPHDGIHILIRKGGETWASSLVFPLCTYSMKGHSKKAAACKTGRELSPGTKSSGTLILDFLASKTVRNTCLSCCLSHLGYCVDEYVNTSWI